MCGLRYAVCGKDKGKDGREKDRIGGKVRVRAEGKKIGFGKDDSKRGAVNFGKFSAIEGLAAE